MHKFLPLFLLLFAFAACESDDTRKFKLGGEPSEPVVPVAQGDAGRLEMPQLRGTADELFIVHRTAPPTAGTDSIVNYAVAYDTKKYHSRWVAFRFDANTRPRRVERKNYKIKPQYPRDPKLPARYALEDDARFDGFDHGHLVASADRLYSRDGNDQTFYLSNMSPQSGSFNQEYWTGLEQIVQNLGRDASFADTLYVVKGGTIDREADILRYVSRNRIPVPKYYFMALLKVKNNTFSSIAFLLEHKDYGVSGTRERIASHIISVRELEERTGINFFHNLPDVIEQRVEAEVARSSWRF